MSAKRRISYVIPPPTEPIPRLQLPSFGASRSGSAGPLLIPAHVNSPDDYPKWSRHPRHRLGVNALALDYSTQLVGRSAPEGILYSGGRDGLVLSWDLQLPMKKRSQRENERKHSWEVMTGWADDALDSEEEDFPMTSSGDILGTVVGNADRRKKATRNGFPLPHEHHWETDLDAFQPGQPSHFRQCAQPHFLTGWVNDICLVNYNQTVITGSSDGTIKAWNPHSPIPSDPSVIGAHSDYVRCLSYCRERNWIASGSYDRTIKLWDLARSSNPEPLVTLNPADASAAKSSVYALAADPYGHTIASGSPERVVRLWDPRSGKRTGKLVGHTDNIRAILISEDSRYLLTGSADASIKLWSLASQRCLHTFTHHTESVWSLFSSHPSLESFYSGDRSGFVCRVDVEDCADVSEGECILLCQDTHETAIAEGINKIVALDDNLLWTASGSSTIRRWRVPQRRAVRARSAHFDGEPVERPSFPESPRSTVSSVKRGHSENSSLSRSLRSDSDHIQRDKGEKGMLYGIPFESLVKLTSPNIPFGFYSSTKDRDPEIATLYSAASVMSVPKTNPRSPIRSTFSPPISHSKSQTHRSETVVELPSARALFEEREIAADAVPLYTEPDDVIRGDHGLVRSIILNDRIHALTVDTSGTVEVWDIARCICKGKFTKEDVAAASIRAPSSNGSGSRGGDGANERERSPREALEIVQERIEREVVVLPWSTADTKSGVLSIHLTERCFDAEVYADEAGFVHDRYVTDESKLNIGKWVLKNLFLGFIREEQRLQRKRERSSSRDRNHAHDALHDPPKRSSRTNASVISSPRMLQAVAPAISGSARSSPLLTPMIPLNIPKENALPLSAIPQLPTIHSNDATPMPRRQRSGTMESLLQSATGTPKDGDYFSVPTRRPSITASTPDDFTAWNGSYKTESGLQTPMTPSGGLMGRLKNFGKNKKTNADNVNTVNAGNETPTLEIGLEDSALSETKTPLQDLLSRPLTPPPSNEAPLHNLPAHITLIISEENPPSYTTLYRGTVNSAGHDTPILEEVMPMWLLEYLLHNKLASAPPLVKISFVLLPWPNKDPDGTQLPELLNIQQSKLTANRWLRVRKLVNHVQDKLEKFAASSPTSAATSPRTSIESQYPHGQRPPAEELYEILCNDVLLPLDMSLAAVRHYVWRQPTELTLYYRLKRSAPS
ncbi:hypothetical protein EV361DRAFT_944237 [Lentinula raphanica]|uniref:WD40 repeat-like protein n=1 Tax=Lentinula raphanica TaxID=153919 RepID=A0AA38PBZ8_9AGAR|nr:hypothetical protein F5878DRAFT_87455 [Lentinula raphanica]KAJ3977595.1 hypothetical protein EV361DRAFT_944237 [Lentinula raphanica]